MIIKKFSFKVFLPKKVNHTIHLLFYYFFLISHYLPSLPVTRKKIFPSICVTETASSTHQKSRLPSSSCAHRWSKFPRLPCSSRQVVTVFTSALYMGAVATNSRPCVPSCNFFNLTNSDGDDAQGDFVNNMLKTSPSPSA